MKRAKVTAPAIVVVRFPSPGVRVAASPPQNFPAPGSVVVS